MRQKIPFAFRALITLTVSMIASNAMAQAKLSNLITNTGTETFGGPTLVLSVGSFMIGGLLIVTAMMRVPAVVDGNIPLRNPVWRALGGGAMLVLPFIVNVLIDSIFKTSATGGEGNYGSELQTGNCSLGLDQCMMALVTDIYGPVQVLINIVCYVLGAVCVGIAIYRCAQSGQGSAGQAPKVGGTVGYAFGGALLISLGQVVGTIRNSIFGAGQATGVFSTLSYNGQSDLPQQLQTTANNVFIALFAWVQLIGYMAFARGIYLLVKLAQGDGSKSHGQAFTHIIGGAVAINMYPLIQAVQSTLGISLVT